MRGAMHSHSQRRSSTSLPFASPPPLPRELAVRLEAEAEGLVQHHVRAYEAHVYQQHREELRDPKVWTRVQSSRKGSFRVYKRVRRPPPTPPKPAVPAVVRAPSVASAPQSSSVSSSTVSSQQRLLQHHYACGALPTQLLGVGFTVGTIEDMLFGASALSTAAIKIQSLYVQDPIVDAAVLATLLGPSPSDPLRSVTLKWIMKKPKMYGVTRHRDYVFIESIGIRRGSVCGERIGYHLMHSIDLPSLPLLDGDQSDVVRRRLSSCYLYRSIGSGLLECFLRSSTDPWRSTPEPLVVYAAATRLLHCCPGFMRVAETNKLIFALQQDALAGPTGRRAPRRCVCARVLVVSLSRLRLTLERCLLLALKPRRPDVVRRVPQVHWLVPARASVSALRPGACSSWLSCSSSVRIDRRPASLCACVFCGAQLCCSRCLVVWRTSFALTVLGGGGNILEKRLRFCRSCLIAAQSASPLQIAASRLS